ncbi:hypothetical protein C8J31_105150 [Rhizobium sp. PP-CC-2G-626]|nr:hypothetical protein C8J31_105150 [Rhizobium sp. PP-CC-2G-626]
MRLLTFRNGADLKLSAYAFEGGRFAGYGAAAPFFVDYATVADVVAGGGQEFICIQGVTGVDLDLKSFGYAGRLLRTAKGATGHPRTGGMRGTVTTTRNPDLSKARTAQSIWADYGTDTGVGYWGTLDRITDDFAAYGPVWIGLNDIMIKTMDCAYGVSGPIFRGCAVVKGDLWYIGDIDGNPSGYHAVFEKSGSIPCVAVDVKSMTFLTAANGVLLDSVSDFRSSISHYGAGLTYGTILESRNSKDVDVVLKGGDAGSSLAYIHGAQTGDHDLCVTATTGTNSNSVFIAEDVPAESVFHIWAHLNGLPAGQSGIIVGTTATVVIDNGDFKGDADSSCITITQNPNNVKFLSGKKRGPCALYGGFTPSYVGPAVS